MTGGAAAAVGADDFRAWMSRYPTGVSIVTTTDPDGHPRGMACSSLASVTLDPPTVAVSLRSEAVTCRAVEARGEFAVNLLHSGGRHAAQVFSGPVADRFAAVQWQWSTGKLPWLRADAYALAECQVAGAVVVGDHTIVLGGVVGLVAGEGDPLLYAHRAYQRLHP
ncbi:flavin reductase family protein [Nonomuraea sp. 10N515B]|uniref:flavin reductase family protein n=1 Tax=Nonomuraea sp. 10N515B TaxID=3457422 RepID=UPI003FCD4A2E